MKANLKETLKSLPKKIWPAISHNIGLKLLSVALSVLLWSYVITTDSSITRNKTITGLTGYINGQATLNAYRLALASDPTASLADVSVTLEVPHSDYAFVSQDNVQVALDLTSVRSSGTQSVPLRATTSYGKVVRITPESLTLSFEALDSRSVPVNVTFEGAEKAGYWYNKNRINPQQLSISGAASIVQDISSASVVIDVTDREESYTTAAKFVLYDNEGNEIPQELLDCSASSITVGIDVYPTRELAISTNVEDVIDGQVSEGYVIESISIQPETVTIAADKDLLDSLDALLIEPIQLYSATNSFSRRVPLAPLANIKYSSADEVYVTVQIAEETVTETIEDVNLMFIGRDDSLSLTWNNDAFIVRATGPKSRISSLQSKGISAIVDLTGLKAGVHDVPLVLSGEDYPDVTFELQPPTVRVELKLQAAE